MCATSPGFSCILRLHFTSAVTQIEGGLSLGKMEKWRPGRGQFDPLGPHSPQLPRVAWQRAGLSASEPEVRPAAGAELSSAPGQHWGPFLLPLRPLVPQVSPADLQLGVMVWKCLTGSGTKKALPRENKEGPGPGKRGAASVPASLLRVPTLEPTLCQEWAQTPYSQCSQPRGSGHPS